MATTLTEVAELVKADDAGKHDVTANATAIKMHQDGSLNIGGENPLLYTYLRPTDWALTQLLQRASVPVRYGKRIPEWLRAECVNHGIDEYGKNLVLRVKGNSIRAVVTDKYAPFDNTRVMEALENILPGNVNFEVERAQITDRMFTVSIILPDLKENFGNGREDIISAGVLIGNSEVGAASVFAMPRLLRQICTNGMVAWVGGGDGFSLRHIGHNEYEMEIGLSDYIARAAQVCDEALDKVRETVTQRISEPLSLIEKLAEKRGLSRRFADEAKSNLESYTAFGVLNAITAGARGIEDPQRRMETEAFAGFLLEHPELMDISELERVEKISISGIDEPDVC